MTISRRSLTLLALTAIVALSVIAAACSSGDDVTPTGSTSPTTAAVVTKTPPEGGGITPAATNGGVVGPTSSPSGPSERVVELIDSGYTAQNGSVSGGVILHNKNQTEAVIVTYTVTLVFPDNSEQKVANTNAILLPNQSLGDGFGSHYDDAAHPTVASVKISLDLNQARWQPFSQPGELTTTVSASDKQVAHGTVVNPFAHDTGALTLATLAFNSDGKIIGGQDSRLDSISPNLSKDFQSAVPLVQNGDNTAQVKVFASFADDFPAWMLAP
ncbi:MAG: hypothetical protein ABI559_09775 [Chloroflexota bacterium]